MSVTEAIRTLTGEPAPEDTIPDSAARMHSIETLNEIDAAIDRTIREWCDARCIRWAGYGPECWSEE